MSAAWTAPKTDWQTGDPFDLVPDYARVRGNLLHLQRQAARLYPPIVFAPMAEYPMEDTPHADFFAALDGNTDALLDGSFRAANAGHARTWRENAPVFSEDDLNRIEGALLGLKRRLHAQENGRTPLAFTLGGDVFGAFVS